MKYRSKKCFGYFAIVAIMHVTATSFGSETMGAVATQKRSQESFSPPPETVTQEQIINALRYAKPDLLLRLNSMEEDHSSKTQSTCKTRTSARYREDPSDEQVAMQKISQKLFGGKDTIFDLLEKSELEVNTTGPCRNVSGQPTSASIFASKKNAICISTFMLAKELNSRSFQAETEILLLSTLAQLKGVSPAEAALLKSDFYDKAAVWRIQRLPQFYNSCNGTNELPLWSEEVEEVRKSLRNKTGTCQAGENLHRNFGDFYSSRIRHIGARPTRAKDAADLRIADNEIFALRAYLCSIDPKSKKDSAESFKGQYNSYLKSLNNPDETCSDTFKIARHQPIAFRTNEDISRLLNEVTKVIRSANQKGCDVSQQQFKISKRQ